MARKNYGGRQPKADLIDVDCRAARSKFDMGDDPLALFGSRTKLMQHRADRIDHWLDPKKAMPIKGGAQIGIRISRVKYRAATTRAPIKKFEKCQASRDQHLYLPMRANPARECAI
jgi:hypothetical protein